MTKTMTTAELLAEHMSSIEDDLLAYVHGTAGENSLGSLGEYVLEIDQDQGTRVVLCTGGPHIELRIAGWDAELYGYWGGNEESRGWSLDHAYTLLEMLGLELEQ